MDIATLGGLVVGVGAIALSFLMEGGHLSMVFQAPAMLLVLLGTLGAGAITTSFGTVMRIPLYLKLALFSQDRGLQSTVDQLVTMAERARREGILGLEADLRKIRDPFFKKAMQLVIDGTEVTTLRSILETEINYVEERHHEGIGLFNKLGGFSPTLGIIGTVLGLIHTLANTGDASKMATSIAAAFIATLWGVGMANLFYLPIGDKLRYRHDLEMQRLELIMEGTTAIQSGDNPRVIRTRLVSFIHPRDRKE
jgi:chemotaxis protein MotA